MHFHDIFAGAIITTYHWTKLYFFVASHWQWIKLYSYIICATSQSERKSSVAWKVKMPKNGHSDEDTTDFFREKVGTNIYKLLFKSFIFNLTEVKINDFSFT